MADTRFANRLERWRHSLQAVLLILLLPGLSACQTGRPSAGPAWDPSQTAASEARSAEDFQVVDCLLPGKVKKLGSRVVYQTPRRPVRATAIDCEIRGGEYVAYDRANYQTALQVWLPQAEAGDPRAQTYVGEIYEKGLGTSPDYQKAARWYREAAEQGYTRAQINLAYLYEQGRGVMQDSSAAARWYARAGVESPFVQKRPAPEVNELQAEIERLEKQSERLREQFEEAKRKLQEKLGSEAEVKRLRDRVAALEKSLRRAEKKLSGTGEELPSQVPADISFGRYYALVIGNNAYRHLPDLKTAVGDAREVAKILETRYDFRTKLLTDASRYEILSALNQFRENLSERDNFILYFAGHGELDEANLRGHWLPVDAEPENPANWISNIDVTDLLNTMSARHVLVVADSCYSGVMTRSAIAGPASRQGTALEEWLRTLTSKRSRTVLTSGGLKPVLDVGGGEHSLFARHFLDTLKTNRRLLEGQRLHREITPLVSQAARHLGVEQAPEYAPIHFAGHEGGDFLFVPVSRAAYIDFAVAAAAY